MNRDPDPDTATAPPVLPLEELRHGRPVVAQAPTAKLNCWEYRHCGREPGGAEADVLGVCPAAIDVAADGLNSGRNAGRICWAVSGHFADGGTICCASAKELVTCMACEFFQRVLREEGIHGIALLKPVVRLVDEPLASTR